MAILLTCPLDRPLAVLRSCSSSNEELVANLRRVKNIIIGSSNRKKDLIQRTDDVEGILSRLDHVAQPGFSDHFNAIELTRLACESLAIITALAEPTEATLKVLLELDAHHRIATCIAVAAQVLPTLVPSAPPASHIPSLLVFSVRALRSLYLAIQDYIDPLDAERWTYDLVVSSASSSESIVSRQQNLVFSARSSALSGSRSDVKSNSNKWQQQQLLQSPQNPVTSLAPGLSTSAKKAGKTPANSSGPFMQMAQDFSEQLCLGNEANLLVTTLDAAIEGLTDDSPSLPTAAAFEVIRCISDILTHCVRSFAQREAVFLQSKSQASKCPPGPLASTSMPTIDPAALLFRLLDNAPAQTTLSAINAIAILIRDERSPSSRQLTLVRSDETAGPWYYVTSRATSKSSSLRLAAAECQVNICKILRRIGQGWERELAGAPIVATLLQLLSDRATDISAKAAFVLAYFVTDDKALQETASNMDAFVRLKDLLDRLAKPKEPYETQQGAAERSRQQQAALLAIAALCMDVEALRRKMLDSKLLPHVISALTSSFSNVRCAAAQCTRALSRSISLLKTAFVDTGAGASLYALLDAKEDLLTQLNAMAVMSNVFTEFSPLKGSLLELDGLVERVIELSKGGHTTALWSSSSADSHQGRQVHVRALLRSHALSTLKNMTYWSSSALKAKTTASLSWEYIVSLLRDPNPTVQAEMFGILRNIACNDSADIDLALQGIGEARLFMILEEALYHTRFDMLLNALYLVVNMATGTESHRSAILNRQGIIRAIHAHLSHPASEIRVAAVWAIANLCHQKVGGPRRYNDTIARLRALGVDKKLKDMRDDPSIDVRERVRDALEGNFDVSEMPGAMVLD